VNATLPSLVASLHNEAECYFVLRAENRASPETSVLNGK
jgi:hypothetical protein